MTPEQKAAFVMARAAQLIAEVQGMTAENMQRAALGRPMAYTEEDFAVAIAHAGVNHNEVITLFHGN